MWKSLVETKSLLSLNPKKEQLINAFCLSRFWKNAIYPSDYKADEKWKDILILSDHGNQILENSGIIVGSEIKADDLLLAFNFFYYHDILIDIENSGLDSIAELLSDEISKGIIRLPHRFGRILYDKFNQNEFHDYTEHLEHVDVDRLLSGTPQGVYQVGQYISGPFGIILSQEYRYLPPSKTLPLWHCSDTGCNAVHQVDLRCEDVPWITNYNLARTSLDAVYGPRSEWFSTLIDYQINIRWPGIRHYFDMPVILAECIIGNERTQLLGMALRSKHNSAIIGSLKSRLASRGMKCTPEELAAKLTPEEQLQALLVMKDSDLVQLIDLAIDRDYIKVPISELRSGKYTPPERSRDVGSLIGPLGLQSCEGSAMLNMAVSIMDSYVSNNLSTDLEWRTNSDPDLTLSQSLMNYLRDKEPEQAIKELVLSSKTVTSCLCNKLNIDMTHYGLDDKLISKILWKCGYASTLYGDFEIRMDKRLKEFNEVLLQNNPITNEDQRELIRKAGVNLFISIEEFIEKLICYNMWLLAGDHFGITKFKFNMQAARDIVEKYLGISISSGDVSVSWSSSGDITLGVGLAYLEKSLQWMKSLERQDRESIKRPKEDMPHYIDMYGTTFPFVHTQFWADCNPSSLNRFISDYSSVVKFLSQSKLANIRNGLDHKRTETPFPLLEDMIACVSRVREAFTIADTTRIHPKMQWLHQTVLYRSGACEYQLRDYQGRITRTYDPDMIMGNPGIKRDTPVILGYKKLLNIANAELYFRDNQSSEYSVYWKNYPVRRFIRAKANAITEALGNNNVVILPANNTNEPCSKSKTER